MAFRDAMEVTRSPSMTWEDWVQEEEEECERHSSTGGDSQPCLSSPWLEGCNVMSPWPRRVPNNVTLT